MSAQSNNLQECYQFGETITHSGRREVVQHAILLGLQVIASEPPDVRSEIDLLALVHALNDVLSEPLFVHLLAGGASTEKLTLTALKNMLGSGNLRLEQANVIIAFLEHVFAKPALIRNLMGVGPNETQLNSASDSTQTSSHEWISELDLIQLAKEAAEPVPPELITLLRTERERCQAFIDEFKKVFAKPAARHIMIRAICNEEKDPDFLETEAASTPAQIWFHQLPEYRYEMKKLAAYRALVPTKEAFAQMLKSAVEHRLRQMHTSAVAACFNSVGLKIGTVRITDELDNGVSFEWGGMDSNPFMRDGRRDTTKN